MQNLPIEYFASARKIAKAVGPMDDEAPPVDGLKPKFYIGLELGQGLIPTFEVVGLCGESTKVLLEYDLYRNIYCSLCLDPMHNEENCCSRRSLSILITPYPFKPVIQQVSQWAPRSSSLYAHRYRSQQMLHHNRSSKSDSLATSPDLEELVFEEFRLIKYKKPHASKYHQGYRWNS